MRAHHPSVAAADRFDQLRRTDPTLRRRLLEIRSFGDRPASGHVVFGEVVAIYLDDRYVVDGRLDVPAMHPIARMGYMDYDIVTPQTTFALTRPQVAADRRTASVATTPWDGVYR